MNDEEGEAEILERGKRFTWIAIFSCVAYGSWTAIPLLRFILHHLFVIEEAEGSIERRAQIERREFDRISASCSPSKPRLFGMCDI